MEIKKITKTDGKRMFVELSMNMISSPGLPPLVKGSKVLLLPRRDFAEKFLDEKVGKHLSYFFLEKISGNHHFFHEVEGILVENKKEFWAEHDSSKEYTESYEKFFEEKGIVGKKQKVYAILKYSIESPQGEPISRITASTLSECYDVQFTEPPKSKGNPPVLCSNQKCKFEVHKSFKFCPKCGRKTKIKTYISSFELGK